MPTYIQPLPKDHPNVVEFVARAQERMGFVPNSMLTMANKPDFMKAVLPLLYYMSSPQCTISPELREMIAFMVSFGSGCRYCQAHSIHGAERYQVDEEKIANLWRFSDSDLFSEAEKAALSFAFAAGQQPSQAEQEHFDAMAEHYSTEEIVDIAGICAIYGFLNRWNDVVRTQLEDEPKSYTASMISEGGWEPGKHGS
jgi:uncharacterized peroxidase-related enzyme